MTTLLASGPAASAIGATAVQAHGVTIDGVTVAYDGVEAVVDASLDVPPGSTVALLASTVLPLSA